MKPLHGVVLAAGLLGCRTGPKADLVLANVTIIDGRGGAPVPGQTIEIAGGKITAIRPARSGEHGTLETAGTFVISGLFDSHVHIGHDPAVRAVLANLLAAGVTSIREMACCADISRPTTMARCGNGRGIRPSARSS